MNNATYQVILSTDGKHTVIVTSGDPQAVKAASTWAQVTYDRIVQRYGLKGEQRQCDYSPGGLKHPVPPECGVWRPRLTASPALSGPVRHVGRTLTALTLVERLRI